MEISFGSIIGIVAALFTSFSFVPQVKKMWNHKSARDVSNVTIIQMVLGSVLWLAYGISLVDFIIIIANVVSISILITGLILYYRYHVKE
jgi:MtN3 and saliva related transmembrane protein